MLVRHFNCLFMEFFLGSAKPCRQFAAWDGGGLHLAYALAVQATGGELPISNVFYVKKGMRHFCG